MAETKKPNPKLEQKALDTDNTSLNAELKSRITHRFQNQLNLETLEELEKIVSESIPHYNPNM